MPDELSTIAARVLASRFDLGKIDHPRAVRYYYPLDTCKVFLQSDMTEDFLMSGAEVVRFPEALMADNVKMGHSSVSFKRWALSHFMMCRQVSDPRFTRHYDKTKRKPTEAYYNFRKQMLDPRETVSLSPKIENALVSDVAVKVSNKKSTIVLGGWFKREVMFKEYEKRVLTHPFFQYVSEIIQSGRKIVLSFPHPLNVSVFSDSVVFPAVNSVTDRLLDDYEYCTVDTIVAAFVIKIINAL